MLTILQKVGSKTVDIITFYNDVFIHSIKTFLLQLGDQDAASKNDSQSGDVNQNDGTLHLSVMINSINICVIQW